MDRERGAQLEDKYLAEHLGVEEIVEPFVFGTEEVAGLETGEGNFPFPSLIDCTLSPDWEPTDKSWFVDSSGFGQVGELALTVDQFREQLLAYLRVHPDHGFALTGIGQFQVYVGAFRKIA